ncbi:MAG: hypothetical protein R8K20_10440, partial [Gallionellaceae bacterium]
AAQLSTLLSNWQGREDEIATWLAGVANGGAGSDGQYPLTDAAGVTIQVNCPAQMQADVDAKIAETTAKEGQPNGIATLDANGELPALPSGAATAVAGASLFQDGTWAAPNIKAERLPDDYQLQVWSDELKTGNYDVRLTVAQGNLAVDWYYVEVIRHYNDYLATQYRTITVTALDFAPGNYGQKFTSTCSNGVWTAWKRIAVDEPLTWITPTLTAPWVCHAPSSYPVVYARDSLGFVHLRGLVNSGSNTTLSLIFTLPVGYRNITIFTASSQLSNGVGRTTVLTSGAVQFEGLQPHTGNATSWLSLDGISFKAA